MAASLWTHQRNFPAVLSNGGSSLDSSTEFSSGSVQQRLLFGLLTAIFQRSCPMAASLWTHQRNFPAVLSNGSSFLDSSPQFSSGPVQWQLLFGLLTAIFQRSCPMAASLWTPHRNLPAVLSNSGSSLDSSMQFPSCPVQQKLLFGLLNIIFQRSCPTKASLWTPQRNFPTVLSNGSFSLDSSTEFSSGPVQQKLLFGLLNIIFQRSCPMAASLWTHQRNLPAVLSNGSSSLDSSTEYSSGPV